MYQKIQYFSTLSMQELQETLTRIYKLLAAEEQGAIDLSDRAIEGLSIESEMAQARLMQYLELTGQTDRTVPRL